MSSKKPDAVATATLTGKSTAAPTCTAGSENFNGTHWFTADDVRGWHDRLCLRRLCRGEDPGHQLGGTFAADTHVLYTGSATSFKLSFMNAVSSVQLDAEFGLFANVDVTLTAFDVSDSVVGSDSGNGISVTTLSVTAATNEIKYFTVSNAGNAGRRSATSSGAAS